MYFAALPLECRLAVLGHLDFQSLYAVRLVSQQACCDVQAHEAAHWYPAQLLEELAHRHRRHVTTCLALCRPSYAWSMGYTQESFVDYFLNYWQKAVEALQAEGLAGRDLLCQISARQTRTMPFCC